MLLGEPFELDKFNKLIFKEGQQPPQPTAAEPKKELSEEEKKAQEEAAEKAKL